MNNEAAKKINDIEFELDHKMHLILKVGQLLMENSADSNRVVKTMKRAAAYMGIDSDNCHIHITYTTVMLNISVGHYSTTRFQKCYQHNVNMAILAEVSKLTWRAIEEDYSLKKFEIELGRISNCKVRYTPIIVTIGAALACGGVTRLFGGDWMAFFYTTICAAIGFSCRVKCDRLQVNAYMGIAIGSFVATICAYFVHFLPFTSTPWHPMLTCAIFIVPGVSLINAIEDMLDSYITAGTTRAINTILMVGSMTFGIVFAIQLCHVADFTNIALDPKNTYWVYAVSAFIAAAGFSTMFNVPPRFLWAVGLGGSIAVCLRNFLNLDLALGQPIGTLVGAMTVSIISLKAMHWLHTPNHVLLIPSVIPLMPGIFMYRLMFAVINTDILTETQLVHAFQNGINATLTILAIAIGVAIPNIFARKYFQNEEAQHMQRSLYKRYVKRHAIK
ncbi:threonine/serine ThrE exporter family protein [Pectinatus brassicae]|uniref:Uncharacterized membrane protein YjjP (DUF1212 family) n=1 Tax=Pectinatus brassicae TaxID=862415 RepID=A0A840UHP7_9FIRM|nr:threonine/serine exporter family protein [Pectinatus brassicae]MBB5336529.1 uncharacterized membrane protein YjjP (DUF1212 family) [Pectinatus brassicae]